MALFKKRKSRAQRLRDASGHYLRSYAAGAYSTAERARAEAARRAATVSTPHISAPHISTPNLPHISAPDFSQFSVPHLSAPSVSKADVRAAAGRAGRNARAGKQTAVTGAERFANSSTPQALHNYLGQAQSALERVIVAQEFAQQRLDSRASRRRSRRRLFLGGLGLAGLLGLFGYLKRDKFPTTEDERIAAQDAAARQAAAARDRIQHAVEHVTPAAREAADQAVATAHEARERVTAWFDEHSKHADAEHDATEPEKHAATDIVPPAAGIVPPSNENIPPSFKS